MSIQLAIILILGFILIYILLIKIFTTLLRLTGVTNAKAKFQAISLISNTGFTTNEAEIITTSKARRNIAIAAMISGHVFSVVIVSLIINLISVFSMQELKSNYVNIILVFVGFFAIFIIFKIPFIKKGYEKLLEKFAMKIMGTSQHENLIALLDNYGKESVAEVTINRLPTIMKDKCLNDINLRDLYKINVLSVRRKGRALAVDKNTMLQEGDILILYGLHQNIIDLFKNENNLEDNSNTNKNENSLEIVDNFGKEVMIKIQILQIPALLKNTNLSDCGLKEKYGINVITLVRNKNSVKVDKGTIIQPEDTIIVVGPYNNIKSIFATQIVEE